MTIEALRGRLAYWQRVLRLQDWDIALRMVTDVRDFADADRCGECRAQTDYRRAVILLLDPAVEATREVRTGLVAEFCYEPEQVLVHELLHLIVPTSEGCEYAVESLAKTLMALDRRPQETRSIDVSTFANPGRFVDVPRKPRAAVMPVDHDWPEQETAQ